MSQANVDKVQEYIAAYNRRDFDTATAWFDPELEWVLPDRQSSDNAHGPAQVIRFWEELDEHFDDLQLEPQEHLDAGEIVATRLRYFGRGKGSGLEIETEMYHQVATFRDGRMVRLQYYGSWPEALAAAGLGSKEGT
jgi:ketosteroid isomerase-like protein